jgi:DNA gyrase subunit A
MLALVNGEPKILPLAAILDEYIKHQESVISNRTRFDLEKALARVHILEGYKIAIDSIDEIVELMKTSGSIPESRVRLCEKYGLSETQAQAIIDMTLGRLTGLERDKILDELTRLYAKIEELRAVLADVDRVKEIIKSELTEIRQTYAAKDGRLTEIVEAEDETLDEDLIEKHFCVVTITHGGYIKRLPADSFKVILRGGKGVIGMTTKDDDFIETVSVVYSHSNFLFFTDRGKVFMIRPFAIPEAGKTAKGTFMRNILELDEDEKVTATIAVDSFEDAADRYLCMVTEKGIVKRTRLAEFSRVNRNGKRAIDLDEGDRLINVLYTDGAMDIVIASSRGMATRFAEEEARCMGRTARGVIGIRLREGDRVVGTVAVDETKDLFTLTSNGYGKRTRYDDFRTMAHRGGMGVCCQKITEKTGALVGIGQVDDGDDVMIATDTGNFIRTHAANIQVYSRSAQGVIVMRMDEGRSCAGFTALRAAADTDSEDGDGSGPEDSGTDAADGIADAGTGYAAPAGEDE